MEYRGFLTFILFFLYSVLYVLFLISTQNKKHRKNRPSIYIMSFYRIKRGENRTKRISLHKLSKPGYNSQVSLLILELAKVCQLKINSTHLSSVEGVIFHNTSGSLNIAIISRDIHELKYCLQQIDQHNLLKYNKYASMEYNLNEKCEGSKLQLVGLWLHR